MVQITDRDKQILRLCYEQRFLLLDHVREFFPNRDEREARRRLQKLESVQLLKKSYHPVLGKKAIIELEGLGRKWVKCQHYLPEPKKVQMGTLVHDALVTSVRLQLSKVWEGAFVPERAIKSKDFPEIPDGIFFFKSGNGIAIELENSDKGKKRFLKLLSRWREAEKILFVLYIASTEELYHVLKKYLTFAPDEQPIGLISYGTLIAGLRQGVSPKVFTKRGEIDLFSRSNF